LHHKSGEIKRVVPKEAEALNEVWLSDRDRFSYTGLTQNRLTQPLRKLDGRWVAVDWETALTTIASSLSAQASQDANKIGALISPTSSLENLYLLKKVLNAKGVHNIDHRLHQQDMSVDCAGVMPYSPISLAELGKAKAILLVGSNLRHEQPIINHRVREASLAKGKVLAINPVDYDFNYRVQAKSIVPMHEMTASLARLALALAGERSLSEVEAGLLSGQAVDDTAKKMAELLSVSGQKVILLGQIAQSHPAFGRLLQLASLVADWAGAQVAWLAEAGNSLGACLLGVRSCSGKGLSTQAMLQAELSHLVLWNVDLSADVLTAPQTKPAEQVIAFSAFDTPALRQQADWLLPIASYGEEAGSFINTFGQLQTASAPLTLAGDAKLGWKVLRVFGNMMDVPACEYVSLVQVTDSAKSALAEVKSMNRATLLSASTTDMALEQGLSRVAEVAIYSGDMLVRQAQPLQDHPLMEGANLVRIHPADAQALGVKGSHLLVQDAQGVSQQMPFITDVRVAQGSVVLGIGLLTNLSGGWVTVTKEQM
jgi:NADH-quinone oxidoreductase subunit G